MRGRGKAISEEQQVMKNSVAVVTGASSGIGEATATRLVAAGFTVYGTSRRGSTAKKTPFEMLALDVTSDASVGVGVGLAGDEESSIAQAQAIFDTNFFGTVRMTRAVVPHMRRQGAGRILNMGSGLGITPMPYMAIYSASKHALEGYSESLDHELRTRGVRVAVIEPFITKTPFDANLVEADSKLDEYRETRAALNKRYVELTATGDTPEAVAEVVLKAATAARPKLRYPVGRVGTFQLIRRFAPGVLDAGIRRDLRLDARLAVSSGVKP
jgi:short-subunit dehydrogenase